MTALRAALCLHLVALVCGHGKLREPPSRNSMWREPDYCFTDQSKKTWDDQSLNCGGRAYQWERQDGKCGACGNGWDKPQDHQPGGRLYKPILGRCLPSSATEIPAVVQVTAPHLGYFEFELCENNDFDKPVTDACLNKTKLQVLKYKQCDTCIEKEPPVGSTRVIITNEDPNGFNVHVTLRKPPGVTCSQCVFRWTYITGNNVNCKTGPRCDNYHKTLLLGTEVFKNCADIAILDDCSVLKPTGMTNKCFLPLDRPFHQNTKGSSKPDTNKNAGNQGKSDNEVKPGNQVTPGNQVKTGNQEKAGNQGKAGDQGKAGNQGKVGNQGNGYYKPPVKEPKTCHAIDKADFEYRGKKPYDMQKGINNFCQKVCELGDRGRSWCRNMCTICY